MKTDEFPHLSRAPIVEAVIELRCQPQVKPIESAWAEAIKSEFSSYPTLKPIRSYEFETKVQQGLPPEQKTKDLGWEGYRFETSDKRQVVQYFMDRFAFSRLAPYEGWPSFRAEALRAWSVYANLTKPNDAMRLGLRFINRIAMTTTSFVDSSRYLRLSLVPPAGLDLAFTGFFHQETLIEPTNAYEVRIVRTFQPPGPGGVAPQLILDIDVFYPRSIDVTPNEIGVRLEEMRSLKNKVFFGCITDEALEGFR